MSNKTEHLMNLIEDSISDVLYYHRKECEDLTVADVKELFNEGGTEWVDTIVEHIRLILISNFIK